MHVLGILGGGDVETEPLARRITERLADEGRVARVTRLDAAATDGAIASQQGQQAAATYGLSDDGTWSATGSERTLSATLDDLARKYDYAVVEGFADATVPTVVLGDHEFDGPTLRGAETAAAVDVDAVVTALADTEPYVTLESLVARVKDAPGAERSGAIATFTGRVRAKDAPDDDPTEFLEFEKYEGVAERKMGTISDELTERDGVHEVRMHHRTGVIEYGEDIVFVVVLAGHREEAFRTVEDGINRLKDEVPIFKKEVTVDEEFWVHDRE
jgi:molybdopterin synthase catalytic subunit